MYTKYTREEGYPDIDIIIIYLCTLRTRTNFKESVYRKLVLTHSRVIDTFTYIFVIFFFWYKRKSIFLNLHL